MDIEELKEIRHTLHRFPELGRQEYKTSAFIKAKLEEYQIPCKIVFNTGVVGIICGEKQGKTVLLRADIDALPIREESNVEFSSEIDGMMHACGHDVHTTCLLGAAKILNENKDKLCGRVILVFQPDEEGDGGAEFMIKEGIMEDVSAAFALHVEPLEETGNIQIRDGAVMASPDDFEIIINGTGGHGAYPEKCVNPIEIASEIVKNYKEQIKNDPNTQIVSICSINGGNCRNAIPNRAVMTGTARSLDKTVRKNLERDLRRIAEDTAKEMGGYAEFNFNKLYPPVVNDYAMNGIVKNAAKKLDCINDIVMLDRAAMTGDDFSYFGEFVPISYFKLGVGNRQTEAIYPIHSPKFRADDDALIIGARLMAQIAVDFLA